MKFTNLLTSAAVALGLATAAHADGHEKTKVGFVFVGFGFNSFGFSGFAFNSFAPVGFAFFGLAVVLAVCIV